MPTIYDWSTTASDNSFVGAISIAEGMSPAHVNDGMRTMMAHVAALVEDRSGVATTGSGGAYAAAAASIEALATGLRLTVTANHANAGAATLNVNALGSRKIRRLTATGEVDLGAGDLVADGRYDLVYNLAADGGIGAWLLVGRTGLASLAEAGTFTAVQTIALAAAGTDALVLRATDDGDTAGPYLTIDRASANPAANDALGVIAFTGRDGAGNPASYAWIRGLIADPANGSEDGVLDLQTTVAGTLASRVRIGQGLYTAGVADTGPNTLNATTLHEGGTSLAAKYGALSGGNSWSGGRPSRLPARPRICPR